jgi:hypothetical protein
MSVTGVQSMLNLVLRAIFFYHDIYVFILALVLFYTEFAIGFLFPPLIKSHGSCTIGPLRDYSKSVSFSSSSLT